MSVRRLRQQAACFAFILMPAAVPAVAATSGVTEPRGIFLLSDTGGSGGVNGVSDANKPYIDGFAWRVGWKTLDTGTSAPNYNFSQVDKAIQQAQAIGKKLTISTVVLDVPSYVLKSAGQTWDAPSLGKNKTTRTVVPWDSKSMDHYRNFVKALADHQVTDTTTGTKKRLADHPTLVAVNAGILGVHSIRDTRGKLVGLSSYSRTAFKDAISDSIHAWQDQFPNKKNYVFYWDMEDRDDSPPLGDEIESMLMSEFDGVKNPKIAFFNEALKGDSPGVKPYQDFSKKGYSVMLQACGSWIIHSLCKYSSGDNSPANGFTYAYNNFGTVYYEIYYTDLMEPSYQSVFNSWHSKLNP